MIAHMIGNYFVEKGILPKGLIPDILYEIRKVQVSPRLCAIAEGVLTREEADRITSGDFMMGAMEQGLLTENQAKGLRHHKKNTYLCLIQVLEDRGLLTYEEAERCLEGLRKENGFSLADMEDLKSDDIERIIPLILPEAAEEFADLAGIAVRMLLGQIGMDIYLRRAYVTDRMEGDCFIRQSGNGDRNFSCALAGTWAGFQLLAAEFLKDDFDEENDDVLDAAGELINYISGAYVSALSQDGVMVSLSHPVYLEGECEQQGRFAVIPVVIKTETVHFSIRLNS